MDRAEIHRQAEVYHQSNTQKVMDLLKHDYDLRNLDTVFDQQLSDVYRTVLPRYARLCEMNQTRALDEAERGLLAVSYASLYASFGDEGTVLLGAAWLATKPYRMARGM